MPSLAEDRLWDSVKRLRLPNLTTNIRFAVADGVGSAYWTQPDPNQPAKIVVDQVQAEQLPGPCLDALLLHELMHHVGYNKSMLNPAGKNRYLVNLALDICLERALSHEPRLKADLQMLNDILLQDSQVNRRSPLHEAMVFLVHSAPPFHRMPRGFRMRWNQLWARKSLRFTAEDVYQLLASIPNAQHQQAPPCDSPFCQRYIHRPNIAGNQPSKETPQATPPQSPSDKPQADRNPLQPIQLDSGSITPNQKQNPNQGAETHRTPFSIKQLMELLHATLQSGRQRVKVNPDQAKPISPEVTQRLVRDIKSFDSRLAVRQLVGDGALRATLSPFLTNPTAKAIADYLGDQTQMYYENWTRSTPTLSSVYFDVSGSMQVHLPRMVAFAATLRQLRPAQVFLFDHAVMPATVEQVASGQVFTGGGTCFTTVLLHVLQHRPRQFFIVTDNLDWVDPNLLQQLKDARIESLALVFGDHSQPWDRSYHVNG